LTTDNRAVADVGRQARLELTFGRRGDRTVLLHSYAEPPFRVGRVLPAGAGVHLILASSAPGIFGGDHLHQTIVVESGARVRLTSQSATQIHATDAGAHATLASTYRVENGGHLECEWDPLIPFPAAEFDQQIHIDLGQDATLLWSDAFMAGREAKGERWRFSRLSHELRLMRAATLAYVERYRITPAINQLNRRWIAEDACYFGTVLAAGEAISGDAAAQLHQQLAGLAGLKASADLLDHSLVLARLVSGDGNTFHSARTLATEFLKAARFNRSVANSPDPSK
jgi:urease accessory protein